MTTKYTKTLFADTYKDDFAEDANFHRVLFNSGKALQARELTQLQTIIQTEMARFGGNIFKDGAAVLPGGPSIDAKYEFIKLNTTTNGLPAESIVDLEFTGATVAIKCEVLAVVAATGSDPATLYVKYTDKSAGTPGATPIRMTPGDNMTSGSHTLTVQTTNTVLNPATGQGVKFSSEAGDFFVQGHFVSANAQTIILSKYSNSYTGTVGFTISQDVVSATDDVTLYDNQGSTPNLSSPGADRYRITLTLVDKVNTVAADEFVFFAKIQDSHVVDQAKGTDDYNLIGDIMAERTNDESGNYIIKPFKLSYDENASDATVLTAKVSPGVAYIDGFKTDVGTGTTSISVNRALTTEVINNEVIGANYGNYILTTANQGLPNVSVQEKWNLYSAASIAGAATGTARIRAVAQHGANYKYYLTDVSMNSGEIFRNTLSIGDDSDNWANLILENGKAVLKETDNNNLFFPLPRVRPKSLTGTGGVSDITLEVQRRYSVTSAGGATTVALPSLSGDETFANANTSNWTVAIDSSGEILPNATFTSSGGTAMTIGGLPTGNSVVEVLAKINKGGGAERTKTLNIGGTVATTSGLTDSNGVKYLDLNKVDVHSITEILDSANGLNDISGLFTFDNGQRDNHYAPGRLILKGNQSAPTNAYAKFDYFTHGATGDFFGVGSYTGQVDYSNISNHTLTNGTIVELRDVLDFRPSQDTTSTHIHTTAPYAGGTARINELPSPADLITADITYFQGRKDSLVIKRATKERLQAELSIVEGVPAADPSLPATPSNAFELHRIDMKPGTLNDSDLSIIKIDAKRYTMADIGRIDRKVDGLAEAATLSLLETSTTNLTILDSAGVNRLKSGFLADNFKNHVFSDVDAIDYRASIDLFDKTLHPSFKEDNVRLIYDSASSGKTIKKGDNVYINYIDSAELTQHTISGTQNLNPFDVVTYNSELILSPASDEWKDTLEEEVIVPVEKKKKTVSKKQKHNYSNSQVYWYGMTDGEINHYFGGNVPSWAWDQGLITGNGNLLIDAATGQVPDAYYRKYNTMPVEETVTEVVNEQVISTTISPYMRSRKIYFKTGGLVPNSTYFAFFNGVSVADWVRLETFVYISDDVDDYGNKYKTATQHPDGPAALTADANGYIEGSFFIPNTKALRFKSGVIEFTLLDISIFDKSAATSIAIAEYASTGAIETKQGSVTNTKSLLKTPGYYDPIAQSFLVTGDTGFFATKVSIYFKTKDATVPVKVEVRPMINGHPSSYDIIPGSIVWKTPAQVNVYTGSVLADLIASPTTFEFDEPIYLNPKQEYAICVSAESSAYSVYISQIREFELGSTEKRITRQPSLGSLFLSQNGSTWEPIQTKDLAFQLHRAKFDTTGTSTDTYATLENANISLDQLTTNPISITDSDVSITVHQPGHGYGVNERVTLGGLSDGTTYGGILGSTINGSHVITAVDYDNYTFDADSSPTSTLFTGGDLVTATRNIVFDKVIPYIEHMMPPGTTMSTTALFTTGSSLAGNETRYQKDHPITGFKPLSLKTPNIFNAPRMIAADSDEGVELAGEKSATIKISLATTSDMVSPVIDMSRASLSTLSHQIDKQDSASTTNLNVPINWAAETVPEGGSSIAKHITTPVILPEESVGLKVLISANRPSVSDFLVYYRLAADGQILKDQLWTLIDKENEIASDENTTITREYEYLIGGEGGFANINFTEFQLKIVMRSTNSTKVPTISNLRAIALAV